MQVTRKETQPDIKVKMNMTVTVMVHATTHTSQIRRALCQILAWYRISYPHRTETATLQERPARLDGQSNKDEKSSDIQRKVSHNFPARP